MALTRLLRFRLIEMLPGEWREPTGLRELSERKVRKLALERVRQAAASEDAQAP